MIDVGIYYHIGIFNLTIKLFFDKITILWHWDRKQGKAGRTNAVGKVFCTLGAERWF